MFLENLNLCQDFFNHLGKRHDQKINDNFKIYDVADWITNNYNARIAHYLKRQWQPSNEIRSANKIQHEKHMQNVRENLALVPLLKNRNLPYLWISSLKRHDFIVCASRGVPIYIKTKALTTFAFTWYKAVLENKRCLELVLLPHFLHDFLRKIFLTLYSINWPNFIAWTLYFLRYWVICVL